MTTTCLIAALSTCIGIAVGLLGVGSSVLTILLLVHVAGLAIGSAIATSLVVAAASSTVALVHYSRSGAVMWRIGAGFSVASVVGAFAGGRVGRWLPPRVLIAVFAMTMAGAAIAML